jgi:hypothetical protein
MWMKPILLLVAIVIFTGAASGQVSLEEAQHRLKARLSTRPSTTQPSTELERLREDNLRLRERIMDLQEEVTTLKAALARVSDNGPGPTTRPSGGIDDAMRKLLLGRWRGGDIAAGDSYTIDFAPDSTYKQNFLFGNQTVTGQYRLVGDGLMQMWTEKTAAEKKHNEYKVSVTPGQLTLTPTVFDGVDVKSAKPMVLQRAG